MGLSLGLRSPGPHNLMSMRASHNDPWAISNVTMCMNKGCLGVALGSDGGSTMHDIDRLRKAANRLRAAAKEAKAHGKSEHANRLQVRAQHCLDDAAVLNAVEIRLKTEQAKPRH